MSSDKNVEKNVWERLFKLWATVCKLLVDDKRDLEKVTRMLQQIVDETYSNPYLRKITIGVLGATTGARYLKLDFWGTDVASPVTEEASFEVFEMIKDGTFEQIFGGFGVDDFKKLFWSQDQIITFFEANSDKLHPKGLATFFLFSVKLKKGTENDEEFFVADVYRLGDARFRTHVYCLSDDNVWRAEDRNRFVVPQWPP
ncbi:MAG: hypothetical protein WCX70_00440 [Candidatus Paceibacterota bacterium]|jgi:hypothetical protein